MEQLAAKLGKLGQPAYRAKQIGRWVWQEGVYDFAAMTDLPSALRGQLAEHFRILSGKVALRSDAPDGVIKLLIELHDAQRIETALIPAERRNTACVSTQVGCAMGCAFCASGMHGLKRNLAAAEIVEQVLQLGLAAARRVSHVVFMGIGEPLANYANTVSAIRALIDPQRLGVSARHITVSTVGLPDKIRRLAREELPVTLAISLHAPNDALRRRIVPAAGKAPLEEIIAAAQEFFASRNRQVTLEYVLLPGLNDTNVCAAGLAKIARRLAANINLIACNPVEGVSFERPSPEQMQAFADRLVRLGANVQIRRSRGLEAEAACGQLRRRAERS